MTVSSAATAAAATDPCDDLLGRVGHRVTAGDDRELAAVLRSPETKSQPTSSCRIPRLVCWFGVLGGVGKGAHRSVQPERARPGRPNPCTAAVKPRCLSSPCSSFPRPRAHPPNGLSYAGGDTKSAAGELLLGL